MLPCGMAQLEQRLENCRVVSGSVEKSGKRSVKGFRDSSVTLEQRFQSTTAKAVFNNEQHADANVRIR